MRQQQVIDYKNKLTIWLNHIPHICPLAIRRKEWHKITILPIVALLQLGAEANRLQPII